MTPDSASEDKARAKAKAAASKKAAAAKAEAPDLAKEQEQLNRAVLEAAFKIADRVKARLLFLIVSDPAEYKFPPALLARKDLVLVMSDGKPDEEIRKEIRQVVSLPRIKLTRVGKVKLAVMRGLSKGLMEMGDKIVCVTGRNELGTVDSITGELRVTNASLTCNVTATKAADANYGSATSAPLAIRMASYQAEINKSFSPISIK